MRDTNNVTVAIRPGAASLVAMSIWIFPYSNVWLNIMGKQLLRMRLPQQSRCDYSLSPPQISQMFDTKPAKVPHPQTPNYALSYHWQNQPKPPHQKTSSPAEAIAWNEALRYTTNIRQTTRTSAALHVSMIMVGKVETKTQLLSVYNRKVSSLKTRAGR
jgi:hypothetical protein